MEAMKRIVHELPPVIVERLGRWQVVVENLLKIGTAASEVSA
jgi:hypothetical protein